MSKLCTFVAALAMASLVLAPSPAAAQGTGTVSGKITFTGTAPKPRKVLITKDHGTCGKGRREIVEVDVKNGLLRDAVVFADGKFPGAKMPKQAELVQKGCRFQPYIQWVPKGEKLKIVNGDPVAHNIHAYEIIGRARRDVFNFQQPKQGHTRVEKIRPRRGKAIQLTCDIHDFMSGWIFVPENPYATVAKDGTFEFQVPAGAQTIKVYHPVLGTVSKPVNVAAGQKVSVEFQMKGK